MRHPPWHSRVFDRGEMLQQRLKASLLKPSRAAIVMAGAPNHRSPWNQINRNPKSALTRVGSPSSRTAALLSRLKAAT